MAESKLSSAAKIIWAVLSLVGVIIIIWFVTWIIPKLPVVGTSTTATNLDWNPGIVKFLSAVLGISATSFTIEGLVLHLAIFVILMFAFSDIIELFSTFSSATSWVIGFGLALIAGVTQVIGYIAGLMGLATAIGAFGIIAIILGAIAAAVTLNLGVGGAVRRWRMRRQIEVEAMKTETGAARVSSAIKGLKDADAAFKS